MLGDETGGHTCGPAQTGGGPEPACQGAAVPVGQQPTAQSLLPHHRGIGVTKPARIRGRRTPRSRGSRRGSPVPHPCHPAGRPLRRHHGRVDARPRERSRRVARSVLAPLATAGSRRGPTASPPPPVRSCRGSEPPGRRASVSGCAWATSAQSGCTSTVKCSARWPSEARALSIASFHLRTGARSDPVPQRGRCYAGARF
jgi:hypothetical protein